VQALRGSGEVALFGNGDEVAQWRKSISKTDQSFRK
jgi:hypothetical protein